MGVYQVTCPKGHPVDLTLSMLNTIWSEAYCPKCKKVYTAECSGLDDKSLVFIKL